MKRYDVIIIGGGASGIMTALQFENSKKKVAIFEMGYSLGKKILVTGNGRCNLTNKNMSSKYYNINIDKFLKQFNEKDTLKYFNRIGLETYSDECGRVYPVTNSAKSVLDVLSKKLKTVKNVEVVTNSQISNIELKNNNYYVYDNNVEYTGKNIVIATGNVNCEILATLGCKAENRLPSLVALTTKENTKNLDGTKISNVKITAMCNGKTKSEIGELLFKDRGLSGIAIFNISTLFARNKMFDGNIIVDLLPNKSANEIEKMIHERCKIFDNVVDIFTGLFVDTIREELFKRVKIDEQLKSSKLSEHTINKLAGVIKNLEFTVNGYYNNNQVVSGGVSIEALTEKLELAHQDGVFVVGEAVDVDGECGGYNLQWAWTSGAVVGKYLI